MLADDDALNAVSRDPGGILESLPPGGIHVAMGTHQMGTIKALADSHAEVGQVLVAAPVLGSPPVVLAGRSAFIVAGPPDAVSRIRPLLAEIGRRTFDAGPNQGSASLMKLANNFVLACAIETMGEAFSLVEKSGASPHAFREILTDGLFACVAYERYSQTIVERKWHEVNITATLGLKDVTLALAAGELVGVPLPSALVCRDRLQGAIAHGDSERDWSVMALEQSRASGLS
jgi:3-hydroxyisobutyrate dehydrogenase-like beta-hydroxyacid dehydrogenase